MKVTKDRAEWLKKKQAELLIQQKAALRGLRKVKALLKQAKQWTQFTYARDASGGAVQLEDAEAVTFCLMGAIRRVGGEDIVMQREIGRTVRAGMWGLTTWNDDPKRTHADVIKALDKTIDRLKEEVAK